MNGQPEMLRQHAPQRRLAGAAQPDERDAPRPVGAAAQRDARFDLLRQRRQLLLRHLGEQIQDGAALGGARALLRQQRGRGKIERLRDGAQHADRRIAGAAFDLRQIPLRRLGRRRQLPARHAALGPVLPHFAPDRGEKCGDLRRLASGRGGYSLGRKLFLRLRFGHRALVLMHYSSCGIMHASP